MIENQRQQNTICKVTNQGYFNSRQIALELIPKRLNQINQQSFFTMPVKQIKIQYKQNSWKQPYFLIQSFKNAGLNNQFFKKVGHDIHRLFKDFDSQFEKALPLILHKDYFKQFFQVEFEEVRKIFSIKIQRKLGGKYEKKCFCKPKWLQWKKKKLIITEDSLLISDHHNHLQQSFVFTNSFQYTADQNQQQFGIKIESNYHNLKIRASNIREFFTIIYFLNQVKFRPQKSSSHYRFKSFAPIRQQNQIQFIIDAQKYFGKVAEALRNAKLEVFMTGWWISPEVCLIRENKKNYVKDRLDLIISQISKRGVKVYIIVYCQSSFLTNDSEYTLEVFNNMGPNVKILRHPDILLPTFWSHYEKLVVIDQFIAFVGGIDLCYGRFDNPKHSIQEDSLIRYPGIDYSNARIKDFYNVWQHTKDAISRSFPRLPWHDISVQVMGPSVKDICNHFIEYWNFVSYQNKKVQKIMLLSRKSKILPEHKQIPNNNNSEIPFQRKEISPPQRKENLKSRNIMEDLTKLKNRFFRNQERSIRKEIEKQKKNRFRKLQSFNLDILPSFNSASNLFRQSFPKKLSQSQLNQKVQIQIDQNDENKVTKIQNMMKNQIIHTKIEINQKIDTIEKFQLNEGQQQFNKQMKYDFPTKKSLQYAQTLALQSKRSMEIQKQEKKKFTCQILRSASKWSIGCRSSANESSIQQAYKDLIINSKNFIYIQNQFFISSVKEEDVVQNKIATALLQRIQKAIEKKEKFHIIVIMPLIPAFPGEISAGEASIPRGIMHWQYRTIKRHKNSLYNRIQQLTSNPESYIKFYGLRVHGVIYDKPLTQILYVHSKLMIVDDNQVIIGSANINDRSMAGDRDSQVCILIETNTQQSNSQSKNNLIKSLRQQLWEQHFGISKDMMDPTNQQHVKKIQAIAKKNTEIYRKIFGCYPDDNIQKMKDIEKVRQSSQISLYDELSSEIKGHVVQFPLNFLSKQSLTNMTPDLISI